MKKKLYILLFLIGLFVCSCQDETSNREKVMSFLEKNGMKMVTGEKRDTLCALLPYTPIDTLIKYVGDFANLRGNRISLVLHDIKSEQILFSSKQTYVNVLLSRMKSRSETVQISESLLVSLGLIIMNVWLDISIPEVVDSEITGVTVFDRWEPKSSDAYKSGEYIYFTIYGVWYWKLLIDGVTDVYSFTVSFSGNYNRLTGEGDLMIL